MKRVIAVLLILLAAFMIGCEEEITVSPMITIISPEDHASVSGEVEIVLDANSDADISKVEIYIDGELATVLTEVSESGLWKWEWDTREIPITEFYSYDYTGYSLHTLYVKAEDGDGDDAGTDVISLIVTDYSIKGNMYSNWRYGFQVSAAGTDWGIYTGGELPYSYYGDEIRVMVSISPSRYYYYSQDPFLLVFARPYLGSLSEYEKMEISRLETAYEYPWDPSILALRVRYRKDTEIDGTPAKEFEFEASEGFGTIRLTLVEGKAFCIVKDNIAYTIYAGVGRYGTYSAYKADLEQLVENFEFL